MISTVMIITILSIYLTFTYMSILVYLENSEDIINSINVKIISLTMIYCLCLMSYYNYYKWKMLLILCFINYPFFWIYELIYSYFKTEKTNISIINIQHIHNLFFLFCILIVYFFKKN